MSRIVKYVEPNVTSKPLHKITNAPHISMVEWVNGNADSEDPSAGACKRRVEKVRNLITPQSQSACITPAGAWCHFYFAINSHHFMHS